MVRVVRPPVRRSAAAVRRHHLLAGGVRRGAQEHRVADVQVELLDLVAGELHRDRLAAVGRLRDQTRVSKPSDSSRSTIALCAPVVRRVATWMSCGRTSTPPSVVIGPRKPITKSFAGRS